MPVHLLHAQVPHPLKHFTDTKAGDHLHAPQRKWQIKLEVTKRDNRASEPSSSEMANIQEAQTQMGMRIFQSQASVAKQQECLLRARDRADSGDHKSIT